MHLFATDPRPHQQRPEASRLEGRLPQQAVRLVKGLALVVRCAVSEEHQQVLPATPGMPVLSGAGGTVGKLQNGARHGGAGARAVALQAAAAHGGGELGQQAAGVKGGCGVLGGGSGGRGRDERR